MREVYKQVVNFDMVVYAIKCIVGFIIGYSLYIQFPQYEMYWALLSILLVISPDGSDSKRLAIERTKANFIGSLVGLLCYLLDEPVLTTILIGIIITIVVCALLKLMSVTRTAIVSLIIVFLYEQDKVSVLGAVERFVCVAVGCLIGLMVTLLVSSILGYIKKKSEAIIDDYNES